MNPAEPAPQTTAGQRLALGLHPRASTMHSAPHHAPRSSSLLGSIGPESPHEIARSTWRSIGERNSPWQSADEKEDGTFRAFADLCTGGGPVQSYVAARGT